MTNSEKYENAFIENFDLSKEQLNAELVYQSVNEWDSVGHMALIATLEDSFDIMMETDDIIEFGSFEKGKELLKKYGVDI